MDSDCMASGGDAAAADLAQGVAASGAARGLPAEHVELFAAAGAHVRRPGSWVAQDVWAGTGPCMRRGADYDEWFPLERPLHGRVPDEVRERDRRTAAGLCAGCDVRAECLALSLLLGAEGRFGVWGGVPSADRKIMSRLWRELRARLAETDADGAPVLAVAASGDGEEAA